MGQVVPGHMPGHGDEAGIGATWLSAVAQPLCATLPSGSICLYSSRDMSRFGLSDPGARTKDLLAMMMLVGGPVQEPYLYLRDQAIGSALGASCFPCGWIQCHANGARCGALPDRRAHDCLYLQQSSPNLVLGLHLCMEFGHKACCFCVGISCSLDSHLASGRLHCLG